MWEGSHGVSCVYRYLVCFSVCRLQLFTYFVFFPCFAFHQYSAYKAVPVCKVVHKATLCNRSYLFITTSILARASLNNKHKDTNVHIHSIHTCLTVHKEHIYSSWCNKNSSKQIFNQTEQIQNVWHHNYQRKSDMFTPRVHSRLERHREIFLHEQHSLRLQ